MLRTSDARGPLLGFKSGSRGAGRTVSDGTLCAWEGCALPGPRLGASACAHVSAPCSICIVLLVLLNVNFLVQPVSITSLAARRREPFNMDQVEFTEKNLLRIRGRIKDLVIKGGVNISPEEIELALTEHESVEEASVVGVPDERLGEELCALVRLAPGMRDKITEQQLREHCKRKVNSLKVPRYIEIVDNFPRTSVGKISKRDIRNAMAEKLCRKS